MGFPLTMRMIAVLSAAMLSTDAVRTSVDSGGSAALALQANETENATAPPRWFLRWIKRHGGLAAVPAMSQDYDAFLKRNHFRPKKNWRSLDHLLETANRSYLHPSQGWKVHVAANPLEAPAVFELLWPALNQAKHAGLITGVKIVGSAAHWDHLINLEDPEYQGAIQAGKFMTIYVNADGDNATHEALRENYGLAETAYRACVAPPNNQNTRQVIEMLEGVLAGMPMSANDPFKPCERCDGTDGDKRAPGASGRLFYRYGALVGLKNTPHGICVYNGLNPERTRYVWQKTVPIEHKRFQTDERFNYAPIFLWDREVLYPGNARQLVYRNDAPVVTLEGEELAAYQSYKAAFQASLR